MNTRPGGRIATRPLHFILVADCSGSMGLDGKIQALNAAVREALPHMARVADDNPYASVVLRVLRFSSGAQWINDTPVAVEQFKWQDLVADAPPRGGRLSAEFRRRLDREGASTGDVRVSLMWHNYNDLDLHVVCPGGEKIYFANRQSVCGGELDVDMNVSPTSETPVENIFWPTGAAPHGKYEVHVNHFRNHARSGCHDPTPFEVAVDVCGEVIERTGRISAGQTQLVHEFEVNEYSGKNAPGNTDLGAALHALAQGLRVDRMPERALPPVLLLLSDGQPTDDFDAGLAALLSEPWAKKSVRLAIGIGDDADLDVLSRFIAHPEIKPLRASNAEQLIRFIKWASTAVVQAASSPTSRPTGEGSPGVNVPVPAPPNVSAFADKVW
jgi:uncharacterized protein YegL